MAHTILTPEVQATIVECIRDGNYRVTAARAAGISDRTMRGWCEKGEAGAEPYASFLAALTEAESQGERVLLSEVRAAGPGWQSKAWILERRWPHKWAARVKTIVAEEMEGLQAKLRAKPELAQQVSDVLASESTGSASSPH